MDRPTDSGKGTDVKVEKTILVKTIVAAVVVLVALPGLVPTACGTESVVWEMDYTRLHFDWNGTWDKTAWWAYALWYLDLIDWSYLWAWYGLGWDQLSPLNTPPSGKINVYFYNSQWGGEAGSGYIYVAINKLPDLELTTSQWFYQTLAAGRVLTHELCHTIFHAHAAGFHYLDDHHVTTEALAYYTGDFIYPWYSYSGGSWHPYQTFSSLSASYRNAVSGNGNTILSFMDAGYQYLYGSMGSATWNNAYFTIQAVGYYMYNWSGNENRSYIATLLDHLYWGANIPTAIELTFGHGVNVNVAGYADTSDFYYYFYHYFWG